MLRKAVRFVQAPEQISFAATPSIKNVSEQLKSEKQEI